MRIDRKALVFAAIFLLSLVARLVGLGQVPYGVTPDELSQGYSAWSLVQTGRDEWGRLDIWYFRSFLDNKSPVLTYLMTLPVALFGLSVWSLRLVPAVSGAVGCLFLGLLVRALLTQDKKTNVDLWAAALLSISFWHFAFSRMALEANVAMTLFYIGSYLFLKSGNWRSRLGATLFLGTAMLTYHATKIFVPMMVLVLVWYRGELNLAGLRKNWGVFVLLFGLFVITVFGQAASRSWELSILSYIKSPPEIVKDAQYHSPLNTVSISLSRALNNKLGFVMDMGLENYLSYYSPAFWFAEGGREITYSIIPGTGLMAWWMVVLVPVGVVYLLVKRKYRMAAFLMFWLLLAGVPAALTKEGYRPNRAIGFMGSFEILAAFGLVWITQWLRRRYVYWIFTAVAVVTFIYYLNSYTFVTQLKYPTHMSRQWREAFEYLKDQGIDKRYDMVLVDRDGQKQSYVAFFMNVHPREFQRATDNWNDMLIRNPQVAYLDQLNGYSLGKYTFARLAFPEMRKPRTLYLTDNLAAVPDDARVIKRVESIKGQPLVEIFDFDDNDK